MWLACRACHGFDWLQNLQITEVLLAGWFNTLPLNLLMIMPALTLFQQLGVRSSNSKFWSQIEERVTVFLLQSPIIIGGTRGRGKYKSIYNDSTVTHNAQPMQS